MIDERVRENIHAGLDGELDEAAETELAAHLERSAEARRYRARMAEVAAAIDSLPDVEPPAGLRRQIVDRVELPRNVRVTRTVFGRVPVFARYGLAAVAALLLIVGIHEYRPDFAGKQELSDMAGTIMPGERAGGAILIDEYSFAIEQLSSAVSLEERDGILVLDMRLESGDPVEITVDFAGNGLRFEKISPIQGDPGYIEVAEQSVQVRAAGRQHFAVFLHRAEAVAEKPGNIRIDYSIDGKLLNSGKLGID
jgi:hypothetical protein